MINDINIGNESLNNSIYLNSIYIIRVNNIIELDNFNFYQ